MYSHLMGASRKVCGKCVSSVLARFCSDRAVSLQCFAADCSVIGRKSTPASLIQLARTAARVPDPLRQAANPAARHSRATSDRVVCLDVHCARLLERACSRSIMQLARVVKHSLHVGMCVLARGPMFRTFRERAQVRGITGLFEGVYPRSVRDRRAPLVEIALATESQLRAIRVLRPTRTPQTRTTRAQHATRPAHARRAS
jgi:hypothetical protein